MDTRLLRPWDFLGKSTGVGCHFLLQGIFPTQGSNPGLPHCRQTLYRLCHQDGLKLNIQKTKIMASSPITSWQIDGETMETVTDFIFWGFKITVDGDCSYKIERHLLLGRKDITNLDSIFKSRDITLPTKVCLVKAMVFPIVMYECESWTIKKAECQRTDAFELVLEKTLESLLDSKEIQPVHPKGNQS